MATTYMTRLFGGRDIAVTYDSGAGTLAIFGQSISIASLPISLQQRWSEAIGGAVSGIPDQTFFRGSFGGDTLGQAVGAILDNQATWRTAVQAVLVNLRQDTPLR